MAAFVKFQTFVEKVAEKVHNLGSDQLTKIEEAVRIERIRRDDEELIELLGASGLLQ